MSNWLVGALSRMFAMVQPRGCEPPAHQSWRRLIQGRMVSVLAVRSLGVVALFGLEITLARRLGVVGYGEFSFALAIATMISRLAPLGWLNTSTHLVSAYAGAARFGLLKGSLILAHAATGVGLAAAAILLALVGPGSGSETAALILRYVPPLAVALSVLELHRHVLRGLHAGDLGEALPVLLLPALVVAAVWVFGIQDPGTAVYSYGMVCVLLVLFSSVSIARRLPAPVLRCPAEFRIREWSLAALSVLLGSASDELTARTAVVVLGALGSGHEVGLYQAAARVSLMIVFALRCLTPVAAPRISVLYHEGRFPELRSMYRRLCLLSLIGSLPMFLLFTLIPENVLEWFGPEFVEARGILRVLSLGYLVSAAAGPCATALMMIGQERIYAGLAFVGLLLNALVSYMLAQHLGGLGAAIGTASVLMLNNALYVAIFFRATAPSRRPASAGPGS
jgi:O-antigen/teichoic acid export membrane protein